MHHDPVGRTNTGKVRYLRDGNPIHHFKEQFHQRIINDNIGIADLMLWPFSDIEDTRDSMIVPVENDISGGYVNTDLLVAVQDVILERIGPGESRTRQV